MIKAEIIDSQRKGTTPPVTRAVHIQEKGHLHPYLVCGGTFGPPLGADYTLIGAILACFPRISTVAQSCIEP